MHPSPIVTIRGVLASFEICGNVRCSEVKGITNRWIFLTHQDTFLQSSDCQDTKFTGYFNTRCYALMRLDTGQKFP
jgi:hypothetical protein